MSNQNINVATAQGAVLDYMVELALGASWHGNIKDIPTTVPTPEEFIAGHEQGKFRNSKNSAMFCYLMQSREISVQFVDGCGWMAEVGPFGTHDLNDRSLYSATAKEALFKKFVDYQLQVTEVQIPQVILDYAKNPSGLIKESGEGQDSSRTKELTRHPFGMR